MNRSILVHTIVGECFVIGEELLKGMMEQILTYPLSDQGADSIPDLVIRREMAQRLIDHLNRSS